MRQGTNEVYFDELQSLYNIYMPFVTSFIAAITTDILVPLAAKEQTTPYFTFGLNVLSWLNGTTPYPSVAYLASVPISFLLIGLTQLVQYLIICKVAGLNPGELHSYIAGAMGHSQGIVSAVAIAASATFKLFADHSKKALRWLFYSGLCGQQAFTVISLEPTIIQDVIEGGEGTPSQMLSIAGLNLKELELHIKQTNKHLPDNAQVQVPLHNEPHTFVVNGPAHSLCGLVTSLRKIRAPTGLDQSKIPFSQCKPIFSIRFLVVGVPYHSGYLSGVTEKLVEDLDEELWDAEDLKIPVFHTEDGMLRVYGLPYPRVNIC